MEVRTVLSGFDLRGFPLSALAAYGLLRVLDERGLHVRLSFQNAREWPVAVFDGIKEEDLVNEVVGHLTHLNPSRYGLGPKGSVVEFTTKYVREKLEENDPASPFLVAYINPWVKNVSSSTGEEEKESANGKKQKKKKNDEVRSPFDTSSGNQRFGGSIKLLLETLTKKKHGDYQSAVRYALFKGVIMPPDYLLKEESPNHPIFGEIPEIKWHPTRNRRTATQARTAKNEDSSEIYRLHPVALLLALEALPFYPYLPGHKDFPLGFTQDGYLLLPAPETPVSSKVLATIIALAPSLADRVPMWASLRVKEGSKGYPFFKEAVPWFYI